MATRGTDWMLERMLRAISDGPGDPVVCRLYTGRVASVEGLSKRHHCASGHEPVEWSGRRMRCWYCKQPGEPGNYPAYGNLGQAYEQWPSGERAEGAEAVEFNIQGMAV